MQMEMKQMARKSLVKRKKFMRRHATTLPRSLLQSEGRFRSPTSKTLKTDTDPARRHTNKSKTLTVSPTTVVQNMRPAAMNLKEALASAPQSSSSSVRSDSSVEEKMTLQK